MATGGFLSPLVGGTGALGQAANQTWQNGQFMPYNMSLPGANLNFQNNTATGSLVGGLGSMYSGMGNLGSGILNNGSTSYNPTAGSYLGNQYNSIYGTNPSTAASINTAANGQFQNLMQAEQPWLQMQNVQNLDSQMAKGTIASTAGQYQTAGVAQAQNSLMSQNANTAYQQALQQAGLQQSQQAASMNAASNVANLQEQESQFAPQLATGQLNSAFSNLNNTNAALASEVGLGGNLGGLRSNANVNALAPNVQAGYLGLQGQSGLLNSLLFGSGTNSGLISGLLGGSGANGTLASLGSMAAGGLGSLYNTLFGSNNSNTSGYDSYAGMDTSNLGNLNYNFTNEPYGGIGTGTTNNIDYSNLGNIDYGNLTPNDSSAGTTPDFSNMNSGFNSYGF